MTDPDQPDLSDLRDLTDLPLAVERLRWADLLTNFQRPASVGRVKWWQWQTGVHAPPMNRVADACRAIGIPDDIAATALGWARVPGYPNLRLIVSALVKLKAKLALHAKVTKVEEENKARAAQGLPPLPVQTSTNAVRLHRARQAVLNERLRLGLPVARDKSGNVLIRALMGPDSLKYSTDPMRLSREEAAEEENLKNLLRAHGQLPSESDTNG